MALQIAELNKEELIYILIALISLYESEGELSEKDQTISGRIKIKIKKALEGYQ
jgi:hypothetical protein